jgi:hypothetical protein
VTAFEERKVGPAGIDYVRRRLTSGKTLSRHLLASHDLDSGSVVAFVFAEADTNETEAFEVGHARESPDDGVAFTSASGTRWRMTRTPNANANLVDAIAAFLGGARDALCIFEHGLARRTDPFLEKASLRVAFYGDEVYPFAAAGDDHVHIADAIGGATTAYPPLVGALTHGDLSTRAHLDEAALASIADETETIIVGAYDGEGYVIWRGGE